MSRYQIESHWHVDAPIEAVWDALYRVEDWPKWRPSVLEVRPMMNVMAPFLGPMFRWNHGKVMAAGALGLNAWLRARGATRPGG